MKQRAPRYDLPKAAPGRLRLVQQFVNTTDHEHTRELLGTPAALEGWLAAEGFVVRSVGPAALRRAHAVREELRELAVTGTAGEALAVAADRARLTSTSRRASSVRVRRESTERSARSSLPSTTRCTTEA